MNVEKGGYIVHDFENFANNNKKRIVILATGSELSIAVDLREKFIDIYNIRIVSMFCINLFDKQDEEYKRSTLMKNDQIDLRIAIEAASDLGWWKYLNHERDLFFGISNRFGASGKAEDLYQYFGLDVEQIGEKIIEKLE